MIVELRGVIIGAEDKDGPIKNSFYHCSTNMVLQMSAYNVHVATEMVFI